MFINSGILGHKSVFNLLKEATARDANIEAVHINLSEGLTTRERVIRRMLCFQIPGSARFSGSNIDLAQMAARISFRLVGGKTHQDKRKQF